MQKSVRLFTLLAAMTLSVAPAVRAEQMGTNPHPNAVKAAPGTWTAFVYNVRSFFGL